LQQKRSLFGERSFVSSFIYWFQPKTRSLYYPWFLVVFCLSPLSRGINYDLFVKDCGFLAPQEAGFRDLSSPMKFRESLPARVAN